MKEGNGNGLILKSKTIRRAESLQYANIALRPRLTA